MKDLSIKRICRDFVESLVLAWSGGPGKCVGEWQLPNVEQQRELAWAARLARTWSRATGASRRASRANTVRGPRASAARRARRARQRSAPAARAPCSRSWLGVFGASARRAPPPRPPGRRGLGELLLCGRDRLGGTGKRDLQPARRQIRRRASGPARGHRGRNRRRLLGSRPGVGRDRRSRYLPSSTPRTRPRAHRPRRDIGDFITTRRGTRPRPARRFRTLVQDGSTCLQGRP
jgi:hypothetical protein